MDMDKAEAAPQAAEGGWWQELTRDRVVVLTIIVGALGYFVDVFDLLLFSILRIKSLEDIGVPKEQMLDAGILLLNVQMAGLLLGGILWGVAGDKFGRLSVLFGSIILYSIGNIANAFVETVPQYAALRFITGVGLAGELGVGVTLAAELLPRRLRGLGTTFIATIGVLGATFGAVLAAYVSWRTAYLVGGGMGLVLLLLRIGVRESGMYRKMAAAGRAVKRGSLLLFFKKGGLLRRYLAVLAIGAPIWCAIGLFITFTPEFAADFGMKDPLPTAARAVLWSYIGLAIGDCLSGVMSQALQSRRKSIAISMLALIVFTLMFCLVRTDSHAVYYLLCGLLGIGAGYWAMFVQAGAEQFGTNVRATAATTVPNMVRGLAIPMTLGFRAFIPALGVTGAGLAVMGIVMALAFLGLWLVKETFHADLDYIEAH